MASRQNRKRLVLLASRFGEIQLVEKTHKHKKVAVHDVIKHLTPIRDGEISPNDPLHRARKLNPLKPKKNKGYAVTIGGSSSSWDDRVNIGV